MYAAGGTGADLPILSNEAMASRWMHLRTLGRVLEVVAANNTPNAVASYEAK